MQLVWKCSETVVHSKIEGMYIVDSGISFQSGMSIFNKKFDGEKEHIY